MSRNVAVRNRFGRVGLRSYCDFHDAVFESGPHWAEPHPTKLDNFACNPKVYGIFKSNGEPDWIQLASGLWVLDGDGDDYITIVRDASLLVGSTISVLAWVYGTVGSSDYAIGHWDDNNQGSWAIGSYDAAPSPMIVVLSDDGTFTAGHRKYYRGSVNGFEATVWHHLAFTFNAGTLTLYVDGVADPSPVKTYDDAIVGLHPSTADATLFCILNTGVPSNYYTGRLALPRIYDYVLTAAQIEEHFNAERNWFGV